MPWPLPRRPAGRDERVLARAVRPPFHVVRARRGSVIVGSRGLRVVFRQVEPHRAAVLFRRGELDEAPVPLGDIRAALADATVRGAVRVRRLSMTDAVDARALPARVREILDRTANRGDYAMLVPEDPEAAAPSPPARLFRDAKRRIGTLENARVRIAVGADATLRYGASLLVASWRDLGLDVRVARGRANARFARVASVAKTDIPVARAVDARFVSPRVHGWREDAQGVVDYSRVTVG